MAAATGLIDGSPAPVGGAFSSLNKIKRGGRLRRVVPRRRVFRRRLRARLAPQTALANARAGKIDVKIAGTRPEQRPRETQGGTSQCAVPSHEQSLLAQLLSPLSVPFRPSPPAHRQQSGNTD